MRYNKKCDKVVAAPRRRGCPGLGRYGRESYSKDSRKLKVDPSTVAQWYEDETAEEELLEDEDEDMS